MTSTFWWNLPAFAVAGIAVMFIAWSMGPAGRHRPSTREAEKRRRPAGPTRIETYFRSSFGASASHAAKGPNTHSDALTGPAHGPEINRARSTQVLAFSRRRKGG